MFKNNHPRKGQNINAISDVGQPQSCHSLTEASAVTHISPPKIRMLMAAGISGHARGSTVMWRFERGNAEASAPIAAVKRPSAALLAPVAGSSPVLAPLDAAIAELQGQLAALQAARDILVAREGR